jgi:hypothetical protein
MGSDFGQGFFYCLSLFYMHRENVFPGMIIDLRLDGAKDHLYDLQVPDNIKEPLRAQILLFQINVIEISKHNLLGFSFEETEKIFDRCLDILYELQLEFFQEIPINITVSEYLHRNRKTIIEIDRKIYKVRVIESKYE